MFLEALKTHAIGISQIQMMRSETDKFYFMNKIYKKIKSKYHAKYFFFIFLHFFTLKMLKYETLKCCF